MAGKQPYFPFYPEDWLTHDKLRACTSAARGLWIDILCLMHKNDRRGYLQLSGKAVTAEQLARMTGRSTDETSQQLAELLNSGVASATDDGVIYSRRMVRDDRKRQLCADAGRRGGGSPKLRKGTSADGLSEWQKSSGFLYAIRRLTDQAIKIGGSVNPRRRKTSGHGSLRYVETELIRLWPVTQMGVAEGIVHEAFAEKCIGGEWFILTDKDLDDVPRHLTLKGVLKGGLKGDTKPASGSGVCISSLLSNFREEENTHTTGGLGGGGATLKGQPKGRVKGRAVDSLDPDFDRFWNAYPVKKAKMDARIAWDNLNPDDALVERILRAVEQQRESDQWKIRRIIPNADTWLVGNRWEDVLEVSVPAPQSRAERIAQLRREKESQ